MSDPATIHSNGNSVTAAMATSAPLTAHCKRRRLTCSSSERTAGCQPKLHRRHREDEQEEHERNRGRAAEVPPLEALFVHEVEHAHGALQRSALRHHVRLGK